MHPQLSFSPEVAAALANNQPLVALESTVITHGLPRPHNLNLARRLESMVRENGATPATVAVLGGQIKMGLTAAELEYLANAENVVKVSRRDYSIVVTKKLDGGTTVAGTLIAAAWAGIKVLATGGIGGVHRGDGTDVSADLPELSRTSVAVICAGAKAILNLPATLEWLETAGVPVIGFQTDEFPAFYSRSSGLRLADSARADSPAEAADLIRTQWALGLAGGVLIANPIPVEAAIPTQDIEVVIAQALGEAEAQDVKGKAVTPFLLARVADLTHGVSLQANLALLENNAKLAAQIAVKLNLGL